MSEETRTIPKPMVAIDGKPMLWHIMNVYSSQGFSEFVIAGGYKVEVIQEWVERSQLEWSVTVIDTGLETQTAGRIRRSIPILGSETFFMTYGDGLGNVPLRRLLQFHQDNHRTVTVTAVRPPARFGVLQIENGIVRNFGEKNQADAGWINGGFFVVDPAISRYLHSDNQVLETDVLAPLADDQKLAAFMHYGFWAPMDTLREKTVLEELAKLSIPPWLDSSD